MKRIKLFLLLVLIMESLIGCGQIMDTLSGGGAEATIVTKFLKTGENIPFKTTGVKVELVDANSQEVVDSKTTNDEDSITLRKKIPFDEKRN